MKPSYILPIELEREIRVADTRLSRSDFFDWLWRELGGKGLLGVHEGTMLSEAAAEAGLETDSWTVDSAEAPRERDWVSGQKVVHAELYFEERIDAEEAASGLTQLAGVRVEAVREQVARDWDAEWKASFLSQAQGLVIPPGWHILPPWASDVEGHVKPGERVIRINPGAGFGTGTHETTQLCLTALEPATKPGCRALDFGSGSGILAIALAMMGAREIAAVEIDPLAIDNANENARINQVETKTHFSRELPDSVGRLGEGGSVVAAYDVIVANILRPVLLEYCDRLVDRLAPGGTLVLSGLIERDVDEVSRAFSARFQARCAGAEPRSISPSVRALGEWRCLVWR